MKIKITDYKPIGKTSDGKIIVSVTVDKLPDNIFHWDIIIPNDFGDGLIVGSNSNGEIVEKGLIEDADWYNAMAQFRIEREF